MKLKWLGHRKPAFGAMPGGNFDTMGLLVLRDPVGKIERRIKADEEQAIVDASRALACLHRSAAWRRCHA